MWVFSPILLFIIFFLPFSSFAKYEYEYTEKQYTTSEHLRNYGVILGVSVAGYIVTQPNTIRDDGSFKKWQDNLGEVRLDNDSYFWNLGVHPYTGSHMYLFYRGIGYSPMESFAMNLAVSSTFEFLIETYTEPASLQDLYNTSALGSLLGYGIENLSLNLLNSDSSFAHVIGHILNPTTMFPFFSEKRAVMAPIVESKKVGMMFMMEY